MNSKKWDLVVGAVEAAGSRTVSGYVPQYPQDGQCDVRMDWVRIDFDAGDTTATITGMVREVQFPNRYVTPDELPECIQHCKVHMQNGCTIIDVAGSDVNIEEVFNIEFTL